MFIYLYIHMVKLCEVSGFQMYLLDNLVELKESKFNIDDGEVMFHNWASDNEVTKYLMWPAHKSLDISKEYIKSLISNYSDPRTYDWGIELKEIGQY